MDQQNDPSIRANTGLDWESLQLTYQHSSLQLYILSFMHLLVFGLIIVQTLHRIDSRPLSSESAKPSSWKLRPWSGIATGIGVIFAKCSSILWATLAAQGACRIKPASHGAKGNTIKDVGLVSFSVT